jgi:uncharacterized protein (TIGR03000 family)
MTHRSLFATPVLVCLSVPGVGLAQDPPTEPGPDAGGTTLKGGPAAIFGTPGPIPYGPGRWCYTGWPYGPRVAPPWSYPGLGGGPYVTYPWGSPGYLTRPGSHLGKGLYICSPPVPVYGPVPAITGDCLSRRRAVPQPGMPFGWVGKFAASPRPRPLSVHVWANPASLGQAPGGQPAVPTAGNGCLTLAVKVPQPGAEVFVDGVKTKQTGTDRLFESPECPGGREVRYEVTVRWVEGDAVREEKRLAAGTPGDVVRLDFTAPQIVVTGK